MYAVPKALSQYKGVEFDGRVIYPDHEEYVPATALDDTFVENFSSLIQRLALKQPARKVPSRLECGFCNITSVDCPDRVEEVEALSQKTTHF